MRLSSLRTPVVLVALLASLVVADRALDRTESERRASQVKVSRFLSEEESDELLVAAVTVSRGGQSFLYGRTEGVWRCLDLFNTPARESSITHLLNTVRDARGVVQSQDASLASEYGFGTDDTWVLQFHGPALMSDPDRDVRLEVEVGLPRTSVDGCFIRRSGDNKTWAVDTNPRAVLDGGGPSRAGTGAATAPMLEPSLVPSSFPGDGRTVVGVDVERSDGTRYALAMRTTEVTPTEAAMGSSGIRWVLVPPDGQEQSVNPVLAISYLSFLRLAPWERVLDPSRLGEYGMETPQARVVLHSNDGRSLALVMGPGDANALHAVANVTLKCAFRIEQEIAELLAPEPERLIFPGKNPWERWLRPM